MEPEFSLNQRQTSDQMAGQHPKCIAREGSGLETGLITGTRQKLFAKPLHLTVEKARLSEVNFYYCIHRSSLVDTILSKINLVHIIYPV
jgi:hypothetical protein